MRTLTALLATAIALPLAAQQTYTVDLPGGTYGIVPNQSPCAAFRVVAAGQYLVHLNGLITQTIQVFPGAPPITQTYSPAYWSRNGTSNPTLLDPSGNGQTLICVGAGDTLFFWPSSPCANPAGGPTYSGSITITLQPVNPVTVTPSPCSGGTLITSFTASPLACGIDLTLQGPPGAFYWVIASPTQGTTSFPDNLGPVPLCTGGVASLLNHQVAIGRLPRVGAITQPLTPLPGLAGVTLYVQAFTWRFTSGPLGYEAGASDLLTVQF